MDEKSLGDLLSGLIPDDFEKSLGLAGGGEGQQNDLLAQGLQTLAGQAGGGLSSEISSFLGGKGALHDATRAAVVSGGSSAVKQVAAFLTSQFHIAPALAQVIAPMVVRLFPSVAKPSTAKPRPHTSKPKPHTSTSKPKPHTAKPAAHAKPKPKPKPASSSSAKPKKPRKRTGEIPSGEVE